MPEKINGEINEVGKNFIDYLDAIRIAEQESLLSDKFIAPMLRYLGINNFREVKPLDGKGGWIDYTLTSARANLVGLELKALHNSAGILQSFDIVYDS